MKNKTLISVGHEDHELETVLDTLDEIQHKVTKVGLEVPETYSEDITNGLSDGYFYEIANYFEKGGVKVVPLDHNKFRYGLQMLMIAKEVMAGRMSPASLKFEVSQSYDLSQNTFVAPEVAKNAETHYNLHKGALDIITNNPEKIYALWTELNKKREEYMMDQINKEQPEVIVLGFAHTYHLRDHLIAEEYNKVDIICQEDLSVLLNNEKKQEFDIKRS